MQIEYLPAPPGWSFPPGYPLQPLTEADLPDMPLLSRLTQKRQTEAVVRMLKAFPYLSRVKASLLRRRYSLSFSQAYQALRYARTK